MERRKAATTAFYVAQLRIPHLRQVTGANYVTAKVVSVGGSGLSQRLLL